MVISVNIGTKAAISVWKWKSMKTPGVYRNTNDLHYSSSLGCMLISMPDWKHWSLYEKCLTSKELQRVLGSTPTATCVHTPTRTDSGLHAVTGTCLGLLMNRSPVGVWRRQTEQSGLWFFTHVGSEKTSWTMRSSEFDQPSDKPKQTHKIKLSWNTGVISPLSEACCCLTQWENTSGLHR